MRANKLWAQVEATFKQMDTAGTELECFQALKKQETLSATHRISNLWEEVQKQKDLERTLQKRYGDRMTELERVQHLINAYRLQAEREHENAAKENDTAMDAIDTAQDQSVAPDLGDALKDEVAANNNDIAMEEVNAAENQPVPVASDVGTSKEEVVTKDIVEAEADADAAGDEAVAPTAEPESTQNEENSTEMQNTDETRGPEVDAAQAQAEPRSEDGNDAAEEKTASATGDLQVAEETASEA